ncbi:MAG: hypothetical protein CVV47_03025 [Spirochaetae bacterium HGW-Spirochaetae-3]|jgi:hypothetical protein|nr:MAG: hypothetical protein CVV47_03025 [Spirochaetae bacterium HGW-Spirochaetae-3]
MNMHARKMIAPVIIALALVGYYSLVATMMLRFALASWIKVSILAASGLVSLLVIWVLLDRIKEIRKGEEDDLGKY